MARMSLEQKLADKVIDNLVRADFDPNRFGYLLNMAGHVIQVGLFKVVVSLIRHWSIDFENDNTKGGNDEYYVLTVNARRLQDTIDRYKIG